MDIGIVFASKTMFNRTMAKMIIDTEESLITGDTFTAMNLSTGFTTLEILSIIYLYFTQIKKIFIYFSRKKYCSVNVRTNGKRSQKQRIRMFVAINVSSGYVLS